MDYKKALPTWLNNCLAVRHETTFVGPLKLNDE